MISVSFEQKNGAIVRQFVGYDRFSGEHAYRQLTELYRALRLYVNFFQPSMKLAAKQRNGSQITRRFDAAQTPFQRLLASGVLETSVGRRLAGVYGALDPVVLLHQIGVLQDALWRLVKSSRGNGAGDDQHGGTDLARFDGGAAATPRADETSAAGREAMLVSRRKYRRERRPRPPRTWRTRPDPLAQVWKKVSAWLSADPERTAKSVLAQLQHQYPGSYPDGQLRTLQRRVKEWRARVIVEYDDGWLREDSLGAHEGVTPLRAVDAGLTSSA